MIKETDGDRFEAMRCLNQDLTFEATKKNLNFGKLTLEHSRCVL